VRKVPVAEPVMRHALEIVRASRPKDPTSPENVKKWVAFGASVRAAQYLVLGGKARALTSGRYHVSFDDVRAWLVTAALAPESAGAPPELEPEAVERVLAALDGRAIVAIDEAYVEFSRQPGFLDRLRRHAGLVILRTLSKAHGLASARCGVAIGAPEVVGLLGRIMPPYALPGPTVAAALDALRPERVARTRRRIREIVAERARLGAALAGKACVRRVFPSEGNFLLVEFADAARALAAAAADGLQLRDFSRQSGLSGCLRITVGSRAENDRLLAALGDA